MEFIDHKCDNGCDNDADALLERQMVRAVPNLVARNGAFRIAVVCFLWFVSRII